MSANDLLIVLIHLCFVLLGFVTLRDYLRHRDKTRGDIALMFGSLALPFFIPDFILVSGLHSRWLDLAGSIALVAQPYLLLRLLRYFHPVPPLLLRLTRFILVGLWVALILGNRLTQFWVVVGLAAIIVYFALVDGYAMVAFVRGALSASGVVRYRLRFAAAGSGLLALALVVLGLLLVVPVLTDVIAALTYLLIAASALTYYVGFAPPRWLRRAWQLTELRSFLLRINSKPIGTRLNVQQGLDELCSSAYLAVGGVAALVAEPNHLEDGWTLHHTSDHPEFVASVLDEGGIVGRVARERRPLSIRVSGVVSENDRRLLQLAQADTLLVAPISSAERSWGVLLVFLRHSSLFIDDDLDLVMLLAQQSAVFLENGALLEEMHHYSEQLEKKVDERTSELSESRAQYRRLLETAQEGVWVTDTDNQTTFVNARMAEMLGYSVEELLAASVTTFMDEEERAIVRENQERRRQGLKENYEFRFRRKDGSDLFTLVAATPLLNEGVYIGALAMVADITERKRAEERIQKLNRIYAVLSDVNQAIVRIRQMTTLFEKVCQIAIEKGNFRIAWIGLTDPVTGKVNRVAHAGTADGYQEALNTLSREAPMWHPLTTAVRTGERWVCNNLENDPQMTDWLEEASRLDYRALAVFPLLIAGQVRGVISLYAGQPDFFNAEELKLLDEMALDIAFALEFAEQDDQRQQAEMTIQRYAQRMEILHQIDQGLIQGGSVQALVEVTLKHLRQMIPCQRIDVSIMDYTADEALIFAVGLDGSTALGQGVRVPIPENVFEGYDARHLRLFEDIRLFQETRPRARQLVNEGLLCALSVLLMDQDRPSGVLGLFSDTPGYFTAEHADIAAEIASQLAIAIRQLHLKEELSNYAAQLEEKVTQRTADVTEAKERVEGILNNATDGILLLHPDLAIQQTNASFNRLFACPIDSYFGKSLLILVEAEDADLVAETVHAVVAEQRERNIEIRVLRRDGTLFDAELSLGSIKGDGLVCSIRDITARKAQERQLRYYASLQESVTDAVISTDLNFHIQSWNPAAERIYGWRAEEVIGRPSHDILQTEQLSGLPRERVVQDFMAVGHATGEVIQRHRDGRLLNILGSTVLFNDENGHPIGIVAVNHDITERKRAEDALREQHDFLELIINSVPDLIIVKDREGHFQLVNNLVAQIYGITPVEMVGKTDADFNPNQAEVDFYLQKDRQALDNEEPVFISEETILARYYQTNKIPLKNQAEHYDRLLIVAADITERKQAEVALRQAFEKEKELSELKSRFVSMASHEFRTPLASILAVSETLSLYRHKMTDEQIGQRLGKIREQVDHLRDIMDDVLQLARLQARRAEFNPVLLDLDSLCRSVLDEFQSRPDLSQQIQYSCDDALRAVHLDKKLMRQIISNLVSNAIKYSPLDKTVRVSLDYTGEALVLTVSDQGIGIPEADLKHLFEPFHRATNVGTISGTGLGMVIIKESVELHGGTITVESQVDKGTTFIVQIPLTNKGAVDHDENSGD